MTPEQFEKRLLRLERKVCCLATPPAPDCPIPSGPCEFDSPEVWSDQTGGILYSLFVTYTDLSGTINSSFIQWTSNTGQTPQEFLDDLNATYNPNIVFTLNPDNSVHIVASDFAAACFLEISISEQLPNVTTDWQSGNSVDFTLMETFTGVPSSQGSFNGGSWGGNSGPATAIGYMYFDNSTDAITFSYNAAIPSGVSVCVHLLQNSVEITGSPFNINIPGAGTGTVQITGLLGTLDSGQNLEILVDNAC